MGSTCRWFVVFAVGFCATGCWLEQGVIDVDGVERTYELHVPYSLPDGPVPLVVALHPFTSQGRSMAYMTGFNVVAEREGFIVVYPNGLLRGWNATGGDNDFRDDVAFIGQLVDALSARYDIDPGRIYAVGASNGAMMAYRLAHDLPGRFAAIATVMGATMPLELAENYLDGPPMPVLLIHGTEDRILPYEGGIVPAGPDVTLGLLGVEDTFDLWRERNGCPGEVEQTVIAPPRLASPTWVERWTATGCAEGTEVVLYRVEGGGHTWPGGRAVAARVAVGRISRRMDATEVVWAFFARHARR